MSLKPLVSLQYYEHLCAPTSCRNKQQTASTASSTHNYNTKLTPRSLKWQTTPSKLLAAPRAQRGILRECAKQRRLANFEPVDPTATPSPSLQHFQRRMNAKLARPTHLSCSELQHLQSSTVHLHRLHHHRSRAVKRPHLWKRRHSRLRRPPSLLPHQYADEQAELPAEDEEGDLPVPSSAVPAPTQFTTLNQSTRSPLSTKRGRPSTSLE